LFNLTAAAALLITAAAAAAATTLIELLNLLQEVNYSKPKKHDRIWYKFEPKKCAQKCKGSS
jgi:hypothetical protein